MRVALIKAQPRCDRRVTKPDVAVLDADAKAAAGRAIELEIAGDDRLGQRHRKPSAQHLLFKAMSEIDLGDQHIDRGIDCNHAADGDKRRVTRNADCVDRNISARRRHDPGKTVAGAEQIGTAAALGRESWRSKQRGRHKDCAMPSGGLLHHQVCPHHLFSSDQLLSKQAPLRPGPFTTRTCGRCHWTAV